VTRGFVVGGRVAGVVVLGDVVTGTVLGGSVVTGAVIAGNVVGLVARTAVVVVECAGGFEGTSFFEVCDACRASARTDTTKTITTASAIVDHSGQVRSRPTEARSWVGTRAAGITAVRSSGGTTGTGSVGSSSGGYHRPSEASHHPGSSGR
jgi:hypothetical protein